MTGLSGDILITGGSGTLGHAIVRTAQQQGWDCNITIYSRSEFLQAQMRAKYPQLRYIIGDVRDYDRLLASVAGHNLVIHAAAMKRIPECEANPTECYDTNVLGSYNVLRACVNNNVERCIAISTDKACRSITAYGSSKLMLEKLFQAAPDNSTTCTLVRYGNVVASRGSVVPMWRRQAALGMPITITDTRCTRFWMAESDAVDLVVQALSDMHGCIRVPKMSALNIVDMAEMIVPNSDMVEQGFRSCEKLHEDLVHDDELVNEYDTYFLIGNAGKTGKRYTSFGAPKLSTKQFLAMVEEAEAHD